MPASDPRFAVAIEKFDALNARDPNGKELLYLGGPSGGTVVSVNIDVAGDTVNPGARLELFASGHAFRSEWTQYFRS